VLLAYLVTLAILATTLGTVVATLLGLAVRGVVGWAIWMLRRERLRPVVEV
jgi:hypothetical protein